MAQTGAFSSGEMDLLGLISRAAFLNPFSDERKELDLQIAGQVGGATRSEVVRNAVGRVIEKVRSLESAGGAHLSRYAGDEHTLMRNVFAFEAFYRFVEPFDRLIEEQLHGRASACEVPFGRDAISVLRKRGFSDADSVLGFGLFYQLRRAFFFIDHALVGDCDSMKRLRRRLWNSVFTSNIEWYALHLWDRMEDFSTFLVGETGTGKGQAAQAIGYSGFIPFDEKKQCFAENFTQNFISINLSQYPENLIESELFGYRKGSFTGAIQDHLGVFSLCRPHGSIFLDEVGDVSESIQIKLLNVLQERIFSEVGSHEKLPFRGRVIAATNKDLRVLRQQGEIRDDFFYRLCSDIIVMPTLRERIAEHPDELDELLAHVTKRMVGQELPEMVDAIRSALRRDLSPGYPWPGNVRELEQAVRQVLFTQHYYGDQWFPASPMGMDFLQAVEAGTLDANGILGTCCKTLYERCGSYEEVAKKLRLDWRTVKKHVLA